MSILIKNAVIVTMNQSREVFSGSVLIEKNKIAKIVKGKTPSVFASKVIDAEGGFLIPGLIQTHVHLCQMLLRGYADDMSLMTWLSNRIWPMESLHSKESLKASAQFGLLEMQRLGTTSIADFGTVNHTDSLFEAAIESGIRYWGGKTFMDYKPMSGPLYESTESCIRSTEKLIEKWSKTHPRLNYTLNPRFVLSCSQKILKQTKAWKSKHDLLVHIHASESKEEIRLVENRFGKRNIHVIDDFGLLNEKTLIVHGVHMDRSEQARMKSTNAKLVHCPSANLKLASGIAPTESYYKKGISMSLGADGAPCNNTMDPFLEMRLAALLQKPKFGPEAFPAQRALELATLGGAEALGMKDKIGSIEPGKFADLVVINRSHPSVATVENPYSAIVYSCSGRDVEHVLTDGEIIVENFVHKKLNSSSVIKNARTHLNKLLQNL